jgi:hypothetical protein
MEPSQAAEVQRLVASGRTTQKVALRARIVLLAAQGLSNQAIATRLGTSRPTVLLWRRRFTEQGVAGLAKDAPKPRRPLCPGIPARQTHDDIRHGTTTLFAALNVLDDKVIGLCLPRHRTREFVRFLRRIDRATSPQMTLHLIVDNSSTHKTPLVKAWLKRHPRFLFHFTPTSASWLNLVERFFAEITRKRIRSAPSPARPTWCGPSETTWSTTTPTPSPSPGPKAPT